MSEPIVTRGGPEVFAERSGANGVDCELAVLESLEVHEQPTQLRALLPPAKPLARGPVRQGQSYASVENSPVTQSSPV